MKYNSYKGPQSLTDRIYEPSSLTISNPQDFFIGDLFNEFGILEPYQVSSNPNISKELKLTNNSGNPQEISLIEYFISSKNDNPNKSLDKYFPDEKI